VFLIDMRTLRPKPIATSVSAGTWG
jgi:hypothetical protein